MPPLPIADLVRGIEEGGNVFRSYGITSVMDAGVGLVQGYDHYLAYQEARRQRRLPVRTYYSGMRARLAFGVSMAVPFDCYLVDEVTATGDAAFRDKSRTLFRDRMRNAGAFVVSHSMGQVRDLCDVGLVLEDGHATYYEDLEEAIAHHEANMKSGRKD